ncbi:MAG: hypothetical protein U0905_05785 [Pirellulales bacterium]
MAILKRIESRLRILLTENYAHRCCRGTRELSSSNCAGKEFRRMLRELSSEFGIQIIATTHSPYMLNLEDPAANILLSREQRRNKSFNTIRVDTTAENWMAPFAEHLGISTIDFSPLKSLFASGKKCVLLVEGPIDQEYFELFQSDHLPGEKLRNDVEVVAYGGKDTLKNTLLLQFVLLILIKFTLR